MSLGLLGNSAVILPICCTPLPCVMAGPCDDAHLHPLHASCGARLKAQPVSVSLHPWYLRLGVCLTKRPCFTRCAPGAPAVGQVQGAAHLCLTPALLATAGTGNAPWHPLGARCISCWTRSGHRPSLPHYTLFRDGWARLTERRRTCWAPGAPAAARVENESHGLRLVSLYPFSHRLATGSVSRQKSSCLTQRHCTRWGPGAPAAGRVQGAARRARGAAAAAPALWQRRAPNLGVQFRLRGPGTLCIGSNHNRTFHQTNYLFRHIADIHPHLVKGPANQSPSIRGFPLFT